VKEIYKNPPDSIKTPNLRIIGFEEGKKLQAKRIHNIFNKIITENFQVLRNFCPFWYRKPPGHKTDLTKIEYP
jgi:hypothetical protein